MASLVLMLYSGILWHGNSRNETKPHITNTAGKDSVLGHQLRLANLYQMQPVLSRLLNLKRTSGLCYLGGQTEVW